MQPSKVWKKPQKQCQRSKIEGAKYFWRWRQICLLFAANACGKPPPYGYFQRLPISIIGVRPWRFTYKNGFFRGGSTRPNRNQITKTGLSFWTDLFCIKSLHRNAVRWAFGRTHDCKVGSRCLFPEIPAGRRVRQLRSGFPNYGCIGSSKNAKHNVHGRGIFSSL